MASYEVWVEQRGTLDTRVIFLEATSSRHALLLAKSSTGVDEFVRGVTKVDDRAPEGTA